MGLKIGFELSPQPLKRAPGVSLLAGGVSFGVRSSVGRVEGRADCRSGLELSRVVERVVIPVPVELDKMVEERGLMLL